MTGLAILAFFLASRSPSPICWSRPTTSIRRSRRARSHAPPQAGYPLGTDNFGRSVLDLLIAGARVSLLVGITAAVGAMLIGAAVGIIGRLLRWHEGRHGAERRSRTGSS